MDLNFATICEEIAQRRPDDECLVFRDRRFTWTQTQDRTRRLANVLSSAGLGPCPTSDGPPSGVSPDVIADRVALYLLNGNEYLEGMLGAWKARCVPFNVNYRYVAAELAYLLEDSAAAAVIVHDAFTPMLADALERIADGPRLILAVADGSERVQLPGMVDYEEALAAADPDLDDQLVQSWSPDDVYLCYTGGTTGMPKGAMWRQGDFLVSALGVRRRDGSDFDGPVEVAESARSAMRALPAPPLMHGAAHWNAMSAWIAGGTVIIQDVVDRFDPVSILETVEREHATSLLIVGDPMARPLLDQLRSDRDAGTSRDLSSLRHIISGGAVLSPNSKQQLLDELASIRIIDVLGSTESGRQAMLSTSVDSDLRAGFAPAASAVVLSEDMSRPLTTGDTEIGWLAQSGRVPLGYLGDHDKTARTFPTIDGVRYAVAGDRARVLADGTIELLGRDSVCINTGGEKVFAEEVETALRTHPDVLDAVVCGAPSQRFGQEVVAVVQLRERSDVSDEALRSAAAEHLARYKLPRRFIRRDQIVRSPSGKADYRWAERQAVDTEP